MCYTQTASALLAIGAFAIAAYEHKTFGCWQYTIGLAYFGLMEGLQAVQHSYLAVPDDGYAMYVFPSLAVCKSIYNTYLLLTLQ